MVIGGVIIKKLEKVEDGLTRGVKTQSAVEGIPHETSVLEAGEEKGVLDMKASFGKSRTRSLKPSTIYFRTSIVLVFMVCRG